MKKVIASLIIACCVAGMIACGSSQPTTRSSSSDSTGAIQNNGSMTDTTQSTMPGMPDSTRQK